MVRVFVSGIGLVTPLGASREPSWKRLLAGERSVRLMPVEGEWSQLPPTAGAPAAEWEQEVSGEPVIDLTLNAAAEAVRHAGLDAHGWDPNRCGCVIGTSKGGLRSVRNHLAADQDGVAENGWLNWQPNAAAAAVSRKFRMRAAAFAPVAACATGLISIIRGATLIRSGECDIVLAGSSDASLLPVVCGSYRRLGVLADPPRDDPAAACRPFAADRDGFAIGEGAGVLLLESETSVQRRKAEPVAEYLKGLFLNDPSGITILGSDKGPLLRLLTTVLKSAEVARTGIDYINLHGTGTQMNDEYEGQAVRQFFGNDPIPPASSFKGALGHLLGAAGSVECGLSLLALRDQVIPPTTNLRHPDPTCGLTNLPVQAIESPVSHLLKLSLGFGGHLAAGVFRRL